MADRLSERLKAITRRISDHLFSDEVSTLRDASAELDRREAEVVTLALHLDAADKRVTVRAALVDPSDNPPCNLCGGPHPFDTTVPSELWNRVVRARELPDYLCTTCIVRVFAEAGENFTAELWSRDIEAFAGLPIYVRFGCASNDDESKG